MNMIIDKSSVDKRKFWIEKIASYEHNFLLDFINLEQELQTDIHKNGLKSILQHLRLCSSIPESYGHDTSQEKLYSKYTDALISEVYKFLGFKSIVIKERADTADVEAFCNEYSFIADAKAFRLSRTAKNQKDFKISAMDSWKRGKPFAMVVCPLYQLPHKTSQIYQQAIARDVCIFSYSHLAVLCQLISDNNHQDIIDLIHKIFVSTQNLTPTKDAVIYWEAINKTILSYDNSVIDIWRQEKIATLETIQISKNIALEYLITSRERIMRLSHDEALTELIEMHKIDSKIKIIEKVAYDKLCF